MFVIYKKCNITDISFGDRYVQRAEFWNYNKSNLLHIFIKNKKLIERILKKMTKS